MNIEKEILEIYKEFDNSKKIVLEVSDVYDNVDFKDNVVGNSTPSRDNINTALLSDVQAAAKNAGVKVDVTTAVSGHGEKTSSGATSRHPSGNAVDITQINGKAVNASIRADVDKFVAELVKLGYVKNSESGNPKSVLTFGFPGHDDHVHVSNMGSSQSTQTTQTTYTSNKMNVQGKYDIGLPPGYSDAPSWAKQTASSVVNLKKESINEATSDDTYFMVFCNITEPLVRNGQDVSVGTVLGKTGDDVEVSKYDYYKTRTNIKKNDYNFGKDVQNNIGNVIIPQSTNPKIKSPVSGRIVNITIKSACKNSITIQFTTNTKEKEDRYSKTSEPAFKDPALGALLTLPSKIFKDQYDDAGNLKQKRFGYAGERVDPWIKDAITAPFKKIGDLFRKENKEEEDRKKKKVNENIERIKNLLK